MWDQFTNKNSKSNVENQTQGDGQIRKNILNK